MIRIATPEDIPAILRIYGPYVENTTHSFEYTVPTLEQFRQRFADITEILPWLVWESEGQVLGYAYASLPFHRAAYRWSCEVSIYVAPEAQGKGIGRKLYAALETILFRLGYRVIYSVITDENHGSISFHEKVGYRHVAAMPGCGFKFGKQLGIIWMEKRSDAVEIPSEFPTPWPVFVKINRNLPNILATLSLP